MKRDASPPDARARTHTLFVQGFEVDARTDECSRARFNVQLLRLGNEK